LFALNPKISAQSSKGKNTVLKIRKIVLMLVLQRKDVEKDKG